MSCIYIEASAGHDMHPTRLRHAGQPVQVPSQSKWCDLNDGRPTGLFEVPQLPNRHILVVQDIGRPTAGPKDIAQHVLVH